MGNANTAPKRARRVYDQYDLYETFSDEEEAYSKSQEVVTVMKRDGTALEFARELTVSKLLKDFPGHMVCKAEELGTLGKTQILPAKYRLKKGKTYFVIPQSQRQKASSKINPLFPFPPSRSESGKNQVAAEGEDEHRTQTIKLVMTKAQLAKMIADGSLLLERNRAAQQDLADVNTLQNVPELWSRSMTLFNRPQVQQNNFSFSTSRRTKIWHPVLESILEVPCQ